MDSLESLTYLNKKTRKTEETTMNNPIEIRFLLDFNDKHEKEVIASFIKAEYIQLLDIKERNFISLNIKNLNSDDIKGILTYFKDKTSTFSAVRLEEEPIIMLPLVIKEGEIGKISLI